MSFLRDTLDRLRRNKSAPVIDSPFGTVTESARHQAGLNIRNDADLRARVIAALAEKLGCSEMDAEKEMERRYPEVRNAR